MLKDGRGLLPYGIAAGAVALTGVALAWRLGETRRQVQELRGELRAAKAVKWVSRPPRHGQPVTPAQLSTGAPLAFAATTLSVGLLAAVASILAIALAVASLARSAVAEVQEEVGLLRRRLTEVKAQADELTARLQQPQQPTVPPLALPAAEAAASSSVALAQTPPHGSPRNEDSASAAELKKTQVIVAAAGQNFDRQLKEVKKQMKELREELASAATGLDRWPGRKLAPDAPSEAGSEGGSVALSATGSAAASSSAQESAELRKVKLMLGAAGTAFSKQLGDVKGAIRQLQDAVGVPTGLGPSSAELAQTAPESHRVEFLKLTAAKGREKVRPEDPLLQQLREACQVGLYAFNRGFYSGGPHAALKRLLADVDSSATVDVPLLCLYGLNVHVGKNFHCGPGCSFIDTAPIYISHDCCLGAGVILDTNCKCNATDAQGQLAHPIAIGANVWIGSGAVLSVNNGSIEIGDGAIIGPGAVVTSSVKKGATVSAGSGSIWR